MSETADQKDRREKRTRWFIDYVDRLEHLSVTAGPQEGVRYACPCCHYKTLEERGGYDICSVCFWEDDGQDEADADTVRGGPNKALSLTQARENYKNIGACSERCLQYVRPPLSEEL